MGKESGNNKPDKEESKWKEFSEKLEKETKKQEEKDQESMEKKYEEEIGFSKEERKGIEFPERRKLEDQLTSMELKLEESKSNYLKACAELKNSQQRFEREISDARKYATNKLIADLLPVTDSLIRGLEGINKASNDPNVQSIHKGLQLTLDLLTTTLEKHGVQEINPQVGDEFNPELHEAMLVQEKPDAKPHSILKVLQKGYQLSGRVLRAAMVVVAK